MLRRRAVLLAACLAGMGSLASTAIAGAASPKVYIAMGDSVTQCCSSSGQRYPERLFASLERAGVADTLRNIGVSGATSASILGAQLTGARGLIDDPGSDTTVVTIDIGGNDALGGCGVFSAPSCQPTLTSFSTNFLRLLDTLNVALAGDPGAEQVIVMTYYNPWSGRAGDQARADNGTLALLGSDRKLDCSGEGAALGLNDRIACLGAERGARVADVHTPFIARGGQWFADDNHPNDAGSAQIAHAFAVAAGVASVLPPPEPVLPPLTLDVSGQRSQRALPNGRVRISVRCSIACVIGTRTKMAVAGSDRLVKLGRVIRSLPEGTRVVLDVPLTAKSRKALREALRRGRKPLVTVAVTARDTEDRVLEESRRVRLTG